MGKHGHVSASAIIPHLRYAALSHSNRSAWNTDKGRYLHVEDEDLGEQLMSELYLHSHHSPLEMDVVDGRRNQPSQVLAGRTSRLVGDLHIHATYLAGDMGSTGREGRLGSMQRSMDL